MTSEKYDHDRLARILKEIMGGIGFTLGAQRQTNSFDSFYEIFGESQTSGLGRILPRSILSAGGVIGSIVLYGEDFYEGLKNAIGLEDDFIAKKITELFSNIIKESGAVVEDYFPRTLRVYGGPVGSDAEKVDAGKLTPFINALRDDVNSVVTEWSQTNTDDINNIFEALKNMMNSDSDIQDVTDIILSKLDVDQIESVRGFLASYIVPGFFKSMINAWESRFLEMTSDFPNEKENIEGIFSNARSRLGISE
ncbi:hypothetical protein CMI47_18950 [Candidatus Pacearchaeota archaeon]|nr:hypothetical protein [Candidatus Pacearchaeota archaeon]